MGGAQVTLNFDEIANFYDKAQVFDRYLHSICFKCKYYTIYIFYRASLDSSYILAD